MNIPSPAPTGTPALRVYRRRIGPVLVLSPVGELDCSTVPWLTSVITSGLWRTRSVVLDLSAITFLDCHAIGRLVAVTALAARAGVRVRVAALPDHVHRLFTLFELYPTLGGHHDIAGECHVALQQLAIDRGARVPSPA